MTHQQPCGAEPGGSNWLLLKSALTEYHVFAASKRKRRYSRNIFSLPLNKCNHTPAIPDSKVITTAKRNGTAIPTIGNSVYKGKRRSAGFFAITTAYQKAHRQHRLMLESKKRSIQLYGTTTDNQFRGYFDLARNNYLRLRQLRKARLYREAHSRLSLREWVFFVRARKEHSSPEPRSSHKDNQA